MARAHFLRGGGLALALATATSVALSTPVATAQTAVPDADVLRVDFSESGEQELAHNRTAQTFGDPELKFDGVIGQQVGDFDGDDAWLYPLTEDDLASLTNGFTVECSFRYGADLPPNEVSLCGNKQGGGFAMLVDQGQVRFSVHDGSGYKKASYPITGNTWYHVVGVFGGGQAKLYVNGDLVDTVATRDTMQMVGNTKARLFVVGGDTAPGYSDNLAQAEIEGAYLWSRPLTDAEVKERAQQLYVRDTAEVPPAIFDADLTTGTYDETAGNRPFSVDGEPTFRQDMALGATVGSFDNDSVVYDIGGDNSLYDEIKNGFSVECTFRYNGPLPTSGEAGVCSNKQGGGFSITLYQDFLTFAVHTGEYNYARFKVQPNEWYHTVGVFDGATRTAKLYINGELVTEIETGQTELHPPTNTRAHIWTIAADAGDASAQYYGPMEIANSRIYDTPLTDEQVVTLKNETFANADMSAPTITSISPAADSTVNSNTTFDIQWANPDLIAADTRYFLDGREVKIGDDVGTNLVEGDHTLTVSGKTVFGAPITMSVPFESGTILEQGGTETAVGEGEAELSARANNPTGGRYETTFYEGETTEAGTSFQGLTTSGIPSTLDFDYTDKSDVELGQVSPSATEGQVAFQRFDFAADGDSTDQSIRWSGSVDPERGVKILVWNTETQAWEEAAYGRGKADSDINLAAPVSAANNDNGTVHALVIGVDPFADDINEPVSPSFKDPDDYDFSMVQYSDTQFIAEGATEPSYSEEQRQVWAQGYQAIFDWIKANEKTRKIDFVAHSGDIIEDWVLADYGDDEAAKHERSEQEFEFASQLHRNFDQLGIPNSVLAGNHDNRNGTENGPDSLYNQYFGPENYTPLQNLDGWKERNASYHPYTPDDNANNYELFTAAGLDFVVVNLAYGVTEEEAQWAKDVLAQYPDRNAILITHAYNGPSTQPDGRGGYFSYDGQIIKDEIVDPSPNVVMVLSGHENGTSITTRTGVDGKDHNVIELLADYQEYTVKAGEVGLTGVDGRSADDELKLGSSFLRLFQFDVDRGEVSVDTYSPFLDNFGATEYDPRHRYDGQEDDFTLPIQLNTRSTSFTTSGALLTSATDREIGTVVADSGWPATVVWDGLKPDTQYSWYAVSYPEGATPDQGFVEQSGTFVAQAGNPDTTAPVLTVGSNETLTVGADFDPMDGVTATDDVDGDIRSRVTITGSVDTATPGTYVLSYTVSDTAGNQAAAQRTITVEEGAPNPNPSNPNPSNPNPAPETPTGSVAFGLPGFLVGSLAMAGLGTAVGAWAQFAFPRQAEVIHEQFLAALKTLGIGQ